MLEPTYEVSSAKADLLLRRLAAISVVLKTEPLLGLFLIMVWILRLRGCDASAPNDRSWCLGRYALGDTIEIDYASVECSNSVFEGLSESRLIFFLLLGSKRNTSGLKESAPDGWLISRGLSLSSVPVGVVSAP